MDYVKAYKETTEQLYLTQQQLTGYQTEEKEMEFMFELMDFIDAYRFDLDLAMPKMSEAQKKKGWAHLKMWIKTYKMYGMFYFNGLAARRENVKSQKALLEAQETIRELKRANEILEKQLSF